MRSDVKRHLSILLAFVLAIFGCMCVAHGIQTDHGSVAVSEGSIETNVGDLTYKLYVPDNATADTRSRCSAAPRLSE